MKRTGQRPWAIARGWEGEALVLHVHPLLDLVTHDLDTDECVCGPRFDFRDGGVMIVHHSLDGREQTE